MKYLTIILLWFSVCCVAQNKKEVRATWITTAYGLDWPKEKASSKLSEQKQKEELIFILDKLKKAKFNTVIFQAKTREGALYNSKYANLDPNLSKGRYHLTYDPLRFAINECHKRGLECHAWIVTIPQGRKTPKRYGKNKSFFRKHPSCLLYANRQYFLNPGSPQTYSLLSKITNEIVESYDVDGIHFDYLRYPEKEYRIRDYREYKRYSKGKSLKNWRRENITSILSKLYKEIKVIKPWVKVGICPIGKMRNTSRYSSLGWNAFDVGYQDAISWISQGIIDQIYPMMYFKENHFYPFMLDWKESKKDVQVIPGLGVYFLADTERKWDLNEVKRQIKFARRKGMDGISFYRAEHIIEDTQGIYSYLINNIFENYSLVPECTNNATNNPQNTISTEVSRENDRVVIKWKSSDKRNKKFVIYGSNSKPVETNAENIIDIVYNTDSYIYHPTIPWEAKTYFRVTSVNRFGQETY